MNVLKWTLRILLPLVLLGLGVLGLMTMIRSKPTIESRRPEPVVPLVRTLIAESRDLRMTVRSQGTVSPCTEIDIAPEVSGRVIAVSPSLTAGGFFEAGDVLLSIDPHDFELAVTHARLEVARARLQLEREEAEAEVARREWEELGSGEGTPLSLREPQLAEARAAVAAAGAALEQADRDLERTRLLAPFAGRVRSRNVDIGQFVSRASAVARIYAVDHAEIRLPIPDRELEFVELPLEYRGGGESSPGAPGPEVILRARFAGRLHRWEGRIVRTEGEIDPRTRMVHAVARVKNPYGRGADPERPPLAVGVFVEAEIQGRRFADVIVLPRVALRVRDVDALTSSAAELPGADGGFRRTHEVLVVDADQRLWARPVEILRLDQDSVVIRSGLEAGERVCLSNLETVIDGMRVRVIGEEKPAMAEAAEGDSP